MEELASSARSLDDELAAFKFQAYHGDRLPTFVNDSSDVLRNIQEAMQMATEFACEMEEGGQQDKIAKLESDLTALIDLEHRLSTQKSIFQDIQQRIRRSETINDIVEEYNRQWEQAGGEREAVPASRKYHLHDEHVAFKQLVWNVNHPDEPMPVTDDAGSDDELVIAQTKQSLKCPLTTVYFEEPVTSKLCKHTFSKRAIFSMIARNHGQIECPIPGCRAQLTQPIFYDDRLMERKVARAQAISADGTQTDFYDVE